MTFTFKHPSKYRKVSVLEFFQNHNPIDINNINFVNIESSTDHVVVHLKNGTSIFTQCSNIKNQNDVKPLQREVSNGTKS